LGFATAVTFIISEPSFLKPRRSLRLAGFRQSFNRPASFDDLDHSLRCCESNSIGRSLRLVIEPEHSRLVVIAEELGMASPFPSRPAPASRFSAVWRGENNENHTFHTGSDAMAAYNRLLFQ
jgi:hypothetical protein